jgi:hypothetical protein
MNGFGSHNERECPVDSPLDGWHNAHSSNAPVAQLDRAFGYEPKGRTFESCRAHQVDQAFKVAARWPFLL